MRVIAFDTFGTVFDMRGTPKEEIREYANHIDRAEWSPLVLPKSWRGLQAFPDSAPGIAELRKRFFVVTCSNGPLGLLSRISKSNGISWDAITPLELNRVFKPNLRAYMTICEVYGVRAEDVTFVTANEHFGDIEAAGSLGMNPILIRSHDGPKTILELAETLR